MPEGFPREPIFKIVDVVDDEIKTLFHGNQGSRVLPRKTWMYADSKRVSDGGTYYISGWHVMRTLDDCLEYLKRFKNLGFKAVVDGHAMCLRNKAHSNAPVYLADYLRIRDIVWRYQGGAL